MAQPICLALDQDFPDPPAQSLVGLLPRFQLTPLRTLHPDLIADHDDWEVLRELKRRGGVDGLVTLDERMLNLEKEMVVLHQSRLSLVVVTDVGDNPVAAWGLVLVHASALANGWNRRRPQLWQIRRPQAPRGENPHLQIERLASRRKVAPNDLLRSHRLAPAELRSSR